MEEYSLPGLFLSSFISSTLLPGGSEVLLLYLATQTDELWWQLWVVATLGNTLGGIITWILGRWLVKKFPQRSLSEQKHERALTQIRHWGSGALLLSWVPVIGDPLCFVAGWLKLPMLASFVFIALGKGARYAAILMFL